MTERVWCGRHGRWHSPHVASHCAYGVCPRAPARCPQPEAVKAALRGGVDPEAHRNAFVRWVRRGSRRQIARRVERLQARQTGTA